jgi:alcohol dehydrogenase (NADP+)
MIHVKSYAAQNARSPLAPYALDRREPGDNEVLIDIAYCGVCHSDIHQVRDEWGGAIFPMVPGHEIVGHVAKVGKSVKKFKAGDIVGVGCLVDSCRTCENCKQDLEQYCDNGFSGTYNGYEQDKKTPTYGGYAQKITVDQDFVLSIPENLDLAGAAPLLCAGITTYSPLKYAGVKKGMKVAVVGLGGLGHMGVKFASAFGAETWIVTTSPDKINDAKRLGAVGGIVSKDEKDMAGHAGSFDFILNSVAAPHDINPYFNLLKRDGRLTMVGVPDKPLDVNVFGLIMRRRSFGGSLIGGIAETQEMLDFCGRHKIVSDVEIIPIQEINEAYERMIKGDVRYRFSIDIKSLVA